VNNNDVTKCLNYTLEVLLGGQIQDKKETSKIIYGSPSCQRSANGVLYIVPSGFFGEHYGKPESLPSLPLKEIEGVPLLYGSPVVQAEHNKWIIHADIIASTYFLVTRYEEIVRRDLRDQHGRFPGRQSLPYRAGFIHRPIVQEYAVLLRKWLTEAGIVVHDRPSHFSLLMTHDIDHIRKFPGLMQSLAMMPKRHFMPDGLKYLADYVGGQLKRKRDPFDNLEDVCYMDARVNAEQPELGKSVFFFSTRSEGQHEVTYQIQDRIVKEAIERVRRSGAIVGLHSSYKAGINPELVAEEKAKLEEVCRTPVRCNRHHFLTWREVEDGWALAHAGIECDSTLGYADIAGFRLGVCHPIPLFDPVSLKLFGITEHPPAVMDCTLSDKDYMDLDETEAFDYCSALIRETWKYNGEFVMLWHNYSLAAGPHNYHTRLYPRLLRYAASRE